MKTIWTRGEKLDMENQNYMKKTKDKIISTRDINPLPPSVAVREQKKLCYRTFLVSIATLQKISPLWKPEIK